MSSIKTEKKSYVMIFGSGAIFLAVPLNCNVTEIETAVLLTLYCLLMHRMVGIRQQTLKHTKHYEDIKVNLQNKSS